MAWAQNLLRVPNTFFLSLAWWLAWARILLLFECFEGAPPWDFFVLWACRNRFAKGTGTNPMFRAASVRFRMVWALFLSFSMGSKSDVSAFFRLRSRNGLGTKPAGVLPFRMRVPNTFFLSLAWWLAGFFFVFSRVQKQRFGSFLAAVSHGLGPISFSF